MMPVTSGHGGGYPMVVSWPKPTCWKTALRSRGEYGPWPVPTR